MIHIYAMWPENLARAELLDHTPIRIEFNNWVNIRSRGTLIVTATIACPHVHAIDIDIYRADRAPTAAIW